MEQFLVKVNYSSENLFNEITRLTIGQVQQIAAGFRWTAEKCPGAVLIGGTATVNYLNGKRQLTPDIDFMAQDIPTIRSLLGEARIGFRELNPGRVHSLGITVSSFNADYINADAGHVLLNRLILSTFQTTRIGGLNVKVINPELLAIMKLDLGREQDLNDGFALLKSGILKKSTYAGYLYDLRNDIKDYESLTAYSELL